jgi:hypothetical protein
MKLIREEALRVEVLTEQTKKQKHFYIEGVFLQGDILNKNKRVYPMPILEKEVNRYTTEFIKENRAMGELGHPDTPSIILDNVSHKIISLHREGKNFIGKARILRTMPKGKLAESLLSEGIVLGVSSRGLGSVLTESNGSSVVQEDFVLSTAADIVADPSAPDAFVKGIMEGKEWVLESGIWREEELDTIQKKLKKVYPKVQLTQLQQESWEKDLEKYLRTL